MRNEENDTTGPATRPAPGQAADLDFSEFMDGLVMDTKDYVRAEREHLTLRTTGKFAMLSGQLFRQVATVLLLSMMALFLSIAGALFLGDLLASRPLGFMLVAGAYLVLFGAFLLYWSQGGRDRFVLDRINDLLNND